jgi:hypothetical protein
MSRIEDEVCRKIQGRAEVGLNKYGTTMEREDFSDLDWYIYLQEELMDASVYTQRIIENEKAAQEELRFLRKRNEWLEEVVALLQEEGVDLSTEGFPIWNEDGTITRE